MDFLKPVVLFPMEICLPSNAGISSQSMNEIDSSESLDQLSTTKSMVEISGLTPLAVATSSSVEADLCLYSYHGCGTSYDSSIKLQNHEFESHYTPASKLSAFNTASGLQRHDVVDSGIGEPYSSAFSPSYDLARHVYTFYNSGENGMHHDRCIQDTTFSRNNALLQPPLIKRPDVNHLTEEPQRIKAPYCSQAERNKVKQVRLPGACPRFRIMQQSDELELESLLSDSIGPYCDSRALVNIGHVQIKRNKTLKSKKDQPAMNTLEVNANLLKQSPMRPITEQQLIDEVRGIYAGLVMVEVKGIGIIEQRREYSQHLVDEQWNTQVALHRALLQEPHGFFPASQHLAALDIPHELAKKYGLPARTRRHAIHRFLEILQHCLPDSLEHMLSFIYLAYLMMALVKREVPNFVETWIECIVDLTYYLMAIEETISTNIQRWSFVTNLWYSGGVNKMLDTNRFQHHLAALARSKQLDRLLREEVVPIDLPLHYSIGDTMKLLSVTRLTCYIEPDTLSNISINHTYGEVDSPSRTCDNSLSSRDVSKATFSYGIDKSLQRSFDEETEPVPDAPISYVATTKLRTIDHVQNFWTYCMSKTDELLHPECLLRTASIFVKRLSPFNVLLGMLLSSIGSVDARSLPDHHRVKELDHNSNGSPFLWIICIFFGIAIPILGPKLHSQNAEATSSIIAFTAAIAMSISDSDNNFSLVWSAICSGISTGCTFWLLSITRARQNTILVAFARYVGITAIIWNLLAGSELRDPGRNLDLSVSIPCLSMFGSVGINAIINRKVGEVQDCLSRMWAGVLACLQLERIRRPEQSSETA